MKNILKSLFINILPVLSLVVFITTIINSNFNNSDIGLLMSSLAIVAFFALLFIKPIARTSRTLGGYSTIVFIGFVLNLFNFEKNALLISLGLSVGWLLYLNWYSSFKSRDTSVLEVGKKLPNLTLENSNKEAVEISSFNGNYQIFLFYRGNWCPLCMAQIKEAANQYKELAERNVDMVLVSSQPHKYTKNISEKYKVPFHFLIDIKNKAAKKLGILHENGLPAGFQVFGYDSDIVLPTVIITDKDNTIIFADLTDNYRIRPEPETFIRIIDKHKG
ncbi:MAG: peroxiredoxin [Polaribacter sp.]|jgi:peroxiredoxin